MIRVVASMIYNQDKFLIAKRNSNKSQGELWEFPSGKVEKGVSNIEYKGEEDDFEAIVIKGKDVKEINTNYTWIEFEK